MATKASPLFGPLNALRAALSSATSDYNAALAELERLKRDREEIAHAPCARADLIAELSTWVDKVAAGYESALDQRLMTFAKSGPDRAARELNLSGFSSLRNFFGLVYNNTGDLWRVKDDWAASDAALIYLVGPDRVKALLRARVEALDFTDGLLSDVRRARLAELDAQIQATETELESMREALRASGLAVPAPTPAPPPPGPRI
ncbi:MAG: hypothetical protein EOM91_19625 [Sphingobacteriia bacterium]|nr:hypothetical protein [Sphingobacteriia bacterium]